MLNVPVSVAAEPSNPEFSQTGRAIVSGDSGITEFGPFDIGLLHWSSALTDFLLWEQSGLTFGFGLVLAS